MDRAQVFEAAKKFFGQEGGGLGMKIGAQQGSQLEFFGGGLVWITVWPRKSDDNETRVDLDVSDRDEDARRFISAVLHSPAPRKDEPDVKV
jgi:hypothetical protein